MAYSREWDESSPPGATYPAADIDTAFHHAKEDIRERIEQVIPGWTDETEDPKRAVLGIGTAAERPLVANAYAGEWWFATDTNVLSVFNGTAWVTIAEVGGDGPVEEVTSAALSGTIALRDVSDANNTATFVTSLSADTWYLELLLIRFRNQTGPGDWSQVMYQQGFGHSHLTSVAGGGLFEFLIPDTDTGIYVGTSPVRDDSSGNIKLVTRIVQGHSSAPAAATIDVSGIAFFRRIPAPGMGFFS